MDKQKLISDINSALSQVEADVTARNSYINERDRIIYEDALFDSIDFPDGTDKTMYNYCARVVDIHTSQLMGRGFQVYSSYNKQDADEIAEPETPELPEGMEEMAPQPEKEKELIELQNKKLQRNADTRKRLIDAMIRDNGGMELFKHGARLGSAYGITVYKTWLDPKQKKINIRLLETPQNYYPIWADSDFRQREADAYVYQISKATAYKQYGSKLPDGGIFATTKDGSPLGDGRTSDPVNTLVNGNSGSTYEDETTKRRMVTVIDFTGILPGWSVKGKELIEVKAGEEKPFSALIVGGHVCQVITNPDYLPRFWYVPNVKEPRRAYGKSDLNDSAIEINRTLVETMSTWATIFQKEAGTVWKAKGFTAANIPKRKRKGATFIPMDYTQDIEPLTNPAGAITQQSEQLINELKDSFVRVTGIGRVMFDDPTINPTSNQALMTTLKGVIDIVEDKQSRWDPVIVEMFTDALELAAKLDPSIKEFVQGDEGWYLYVKWPSVLRREDATYQTMYLNRFNNNTLSLGSYLEAMGTEDVTEEIDRIKDEMKDPVTAAILSRQMGVIANQVIAPPGPPQPDVKVNLRGDLTPYQEANLAHKQGFNDGPFPPTAGPQGNQGLQAQENADNADFVTAPPYQGGTDIMRGPDGQPVEDQPNPTLTPDQNTGQTASIPGSGATAVSPEGAIAMQQQQEGR
jgi:hypothetical protein